MRWPIALSHLVGGGICFSGPPDEFGLDSWCGISCGAGARFSLLPPDNASGNFVNVVERVPVRIAWASPPPQGLALRAGLSAGATVHTR